MDQGPQIENEFDALLADMANQNFEVIRFPSYRAACKLRFIQRKTNFHLVDIWNAIEAIRENGLHIYQDPNAELTIGKLETLVTSVYYQLSKRLPPSQKLNLDESIACLLTFLSIAYDPNCTGRLGVFATKLALVTLSSGKIVDKLRYFYSLISDPNNGQLIPSRFNSFLQQSLALACSVYEADSYQFEPGTAEAIFDFSHPISLTEFIEVFVGANGSPVCLAWFTAFQKLADTETVVHQHQCNACHREPFVGLRYKCQKCFSFTMCQDCFWRGRSSSSHNAETHPCKEYCYWQSPRKQFGESLRRSFRCVPSSKPRIYVREEPSREKRLNLAHIVPPSPVPSVNRSFQQQQQQQQQSNGAGGAGPNSSGGVYQDSPLINSKPQLIYASGARTPPSSNSNNSVNGGNTNNNAIAADDDEHQLIAMYARKLGLYEKGELVPSSKKPTVDGGAATYLSGSDSDSSLSQRQHFISQLELRNREMMKEISRLRQEGSDIRRDEKALLPADAMYVSELGALRLRKDELERHLTALQDSRKELLVQLEGLMKLLKNHGSLLTASASASASSTLNRPDEPRRGARGIYETSTMSSTASANSDMSMTSGDSSDSLGNMQKRKEILCTADSVTNAMSSLVKGLNSEDEETLDAMGLNLSKQLKLKEREKVNAALTSSALEEEEDAELKSGSNPVEVSEERLANIVGKHLARRRASIEAAEAARQVSERAKFIPKAMYDSVTTDDEETDYYAKSTADELEDDDDDDDDDESDSAALSDNSSSIDRNGGNRSKFNGVAK